MTEKLLFLMMLLENLLVGVVFLLYPWIVRKGLLFGVYVGEEAFDSAAARSLTRRWYRCEVAVVLVGLGAGTALSLAARSPLALVVPLAIQLVGFFALYLWAYRQAQLLAPQGPPPAAVAPLVATPRPSVLLPALTLAVGVACGALATAHAWSSYDALPATVATHFGISGEPDAWRPKSIFTVMLLPILALVTAFGLGGVAWLTANAKRGLRRFDNGASLAAQMRFRSAMTRFLCGTALLTTVMLVNLSVSSIRVSLGQVRSLGSANTGLTVLLVLWAIAGTVYMALRYGQGGARIERAEVATPLTNGLADNRNWVLGMFYVNRDDPSILVEHRFGLGYTFNLGNRKAVAVLVTFLAALTALVIVAVATG